jgi:hypothetical protein
VNSHRYDRDFEAEVREEMLPVTLNQKRVYSVSTGIVLDFLYPTLVKFFLNMNSAL